MSAQSAAFGLSAGDIESYGEDAADREESCKSGIVDTVQQG